MKKICFVCLGNICRSPMAEFVLRAMAPADWEIVSRATSGWEHGNPVHPGTLRTLQAHAIPTDLEKRSKQITDEDFAHFDRIIAMDHHNVKDLQKLAPDQALARKIQKLLKRDVPDPWYTGDFEETYRLITEGCKKLKMSENITLMYKNP